MKLHHALSRAGAWSFLPLLLLSACSYIPIVGMRCGVGPMPSTSESVAGLVFHMPSAADLRAIGARPINGYYLPIQPTVQSAPSTAKQLDSGNDNFTYSFPAPSGWGNGWVIENVTTSDGTPIASADASAYVQGVLPSIAQHWASDATLDTLYQKVPDLAAQRAGTDTPFDRTLVKDAPSILKNVGWPIAYLSRAKYGALLFYGTGLVVHLTWSQPEDASDTVPIGKARAIAIHVAAMRDPNSQSEEAKTGQDFFLGTPYQGAFPPPVAFNQHDDLQPIDDFPASTAWDAKYVEDFAGKPYWLVTVPTGGGFGMGMVDAVTGAEIRFIRPNTNSSPRVAPTPFILSSPPGPGVPTVPMPASSP